MAFYSYNEFVRIRKVAWISSQVAFFHSEKQKSSRLILNILNLFLKFNFNKSQVHEVMNRNQRILRLFLNKKNTEIWWCTVGRRRQKMLTKSSYKLKSKLRYQLQNCSFLKNGSLNDFSKQHARFLSTFTYQKLQLDIQIIILPKERSQDSRVSQHRPDHYK